MDRAMEAWPARVAAAADLPRWGRHLTAEVLLEIGARSWLLSLHEGRIVTVKPGPFVMPRFTLALRIEAEGFARFLAPVAAARLARPAGAAPPGRAAHRGRHHPLLRPPAVVQGRPRPARRAPRARGRPRRPLRRGQRRAHHRPLPADGHRGPPAPRLCRGSRRRHAAAAAPHRRQRRTAMAGPAERPRRHPPLPLHRLRHAAPRQVQPAAGLGKRGLPPDHRRLYRPRHAHDRGAAARPAHRHGLLHRRPHRAGPGGGACGGAARRHRPAGQRLHRQLLRPLGAAPPAYPWRRGLRRPGLRPGRPRRAGGGEVGDPLALHAGRPRHLPRRPAFLRRGRRPPPQAGEDRHGAMPRRPADRRVRLFLPARRTRAPPPPPSPARPRSSCPASAISR